MVPNLGRTGRVIEDGCHVRIDRSSLPGSPGDGDRSAAAGRSAPPAAVTCTSNQNHAAAIDRQLPKPQTAFAEPPEQAAAPWVSLSVAAPSRPPARVSFQFLLPSLRQRTPRQECKPPRAPCKPAESPRHRNSVSVSG
jgi:hypothetical protein